MTSNAAPARPLSSTKAILALVLAAALPAAAPPQAQERAAQAHVDARAGRVVEIRPRIGPPGTRVTLEAHTMPALTPVQLAIGATRSGFEAIALGFTTIDGDLEAAVVVPDWAKPDQTHRFIAFNLYFSAILAESPIFHVTDSDGRVVREGAVGRAGSECLMLQGNDGERYRLTGATGELRVGEQVRLEGVLTESDEDCGEGLSLALEIGAG